MDASRARARRGVHLVLTAAELDALNQPTPLLIPHPHLEHPRTPYPLAVVELDEQAGHVQRRRDRLAEPHELRVAGAEVVLRTFSRLHLGAGVVDPGLLGGQLVRGLAGLVTLGREQEEQPAHEAIGTPILAAETAEEIRAAARELRMAAITMEALAWQTEDALLDSLIRGADRFLEVGGGRFSDALSEAGHPIPRE